jgi:hypothetical protein
MVTYILVFMGIVFACTLTVLLFRFYFTDRRRMTSMTEGHVVRVGERVEIEKGLRVTRTEIAAAYTARGQEYQVSRVIEGAKAKLFPVGRAVPVRYNPGEPDMSELAL